MSSLAVSATGITCNSGSLGTTCIVSSSQTITEDINCNNLVVQAGATVTLDSRNKTGGPGQIAITCMGNVSIEYGAHVSADEKGYVTDNGTGAGGSADGSRIGGGGGGYGGNGGISYGELGYRMGGTGYGSATYPVDMGSGGGHSASRVGGNGGGSIRLNVSGILTVNGSISALGGTGIPFCVEVASGGGSGGSILILANSFEGIGNITALGGAGPTVCSYAKGGAGGGGRIAIYYSSNTYTGNITAYGGPGYEYGGAGTIYLKSDAEEFGNLIIDNNIVDKESVTYLSGYTFYNVTMSNSTVLFNNTINVVGSMMINRSRVNLSAEGTLTADVLSVLGGTVFTSSGLIDASDMTIYSDSQVTHPVNSTLGLNIVADDLTINEGGAINLNGKGYYSTSGPGAGQSADGQRIGGGGGAYGGDGGRTWGELGSRFGGVGYGSVSAPVMLGSGGGYSTSHPGGNGGGLLNLTVLGTLHVDGMISADGDNGYYLCVYSAAGGGSGGSVRISANTISGSGNISANGGQGITICSYAKAGGGGGGRVSISYVNLPFAGEIAARGGSGYEYGGAGTVYLKSSTQSYGNVLVDNRQAVTEAQTQLANYTFHNLTIRNSTVIITGVINLTDIVTVSQAIIGFNSTLNAASNLTSYDSNMSVSALGRINAYGLFYLDSTIMTATGNMNATLITVGAGAMVTHPANDSLGLNITAVNLTIEDGGVIDANSRGFPTDRGPGAGQTGSSRIGGSGAGYGGAGGGAYGEYGNLAGGVTYGLLKTPSDLGSGGGGGIRIGGSGGGRITINVSNVLKVDGVIRSDGGAGTPFCVEVASGGGSGGSILIYTDVFSGSGNVTAIGGHGPTECSYAKGGGGGGGRIAIYCNSEDYSGIVSASGGTGYSAGQNGTAYTDECLPQLPRYSDFMPYGQTTNFSMVSDIFHVTNLTLAGLHGKIWFPGSYNVLASNQDYDGNIIIQDCFVTVNTSALHHTFNATSYLMINNSDGHCGDNSIWTAPGFPQSADEIRSQDVRCTDCQITEITVRNEVNFRVNHFTGYAIGANSNLTIYDEYEGSSVIINEPIQFFAEYRNKTSGEMILGADCFIEFDDDIGTSFVMAYNGTLYIYNKASGFSGSGDHSWNVTCNATGYNTMNATDTITIDSSAVPEFGAGMGILAMMAAFGAMAVMRRR